MDARKRREDEIKENLEETYNVATETNHITTDATTTPVDLFDNDLKKYINTPSDKLFQTLQMNLKNASLEELEHMRIALESYTDDYRKTNLLEEDQVDFKKAALVGFVAGASLGAAFNTIKGAKSIFESAFTQGLFGSCTLPATQYIHQNINKRGNPAVNIIFGLETLNKLAYSRLGELISINPENSEPTTRPGLRSRIPTRPGLRSRIGGQ